MGGEVTMFSFSSRDVQEHFISAEQLMGVCDQVWSADSKADISLERRQPRAASSVYCKVDHLIGLFDRIRAVRNRVVLVSSESDRPITSEFLLKRHWPAPELPSLQPVWLLPGRSHPAGQNLLVRRLPGNRDT